MKKFYVYVHTCTANGKRYVGCTTQARPELRWREGNGYQYNKHFYSAILKHGWDNFEHEVFEVDSAEEMYRKEIELISFYHSNDPNFGYNNSIGGEKSALGCKYSEEARKHMSQAAKERAKNPEFRKKISAARKGKPFSVEHRRHLSETRKGRPAWNKGKTLSEEARKHMSEGQKHRIKVKIELPDGTVLEISKQNLSRHYIKRGKAFEYVP